MQLTLLKAKLHNARVTQVNLHYQGSVTVDSELLAAAGILPHEQVDVYDITNGARFTTYAIEGEAGSGIIGINGAAARLVQEGDRVILCAFAQMTPEEAETHEPRVVLLADDNQVQSTGVVPGGVLN